MGETRQGGFKPSHSSRGRFMGISTIVGASDNDPTKEIPYMTRIWVGRLRLHIFHRGDADRDCHDHPWNFWTFPLTSYQEEVLHRPEGDDPYTTIETVKAFRLHYRPSTYAHRVLDNANGRKIVTLVWRTDFNRNWGFFKNRNDQWCWINWRDYVYSGGKAAPCLDDQLLGSKTPREDA